MDGHPMSHAPTKRAPFRLLDLPPETIEGVLTYVLFDCAHICHRCSRSRLSHPFVQLAQPVCLVNKKLHSLAVGLIFRVAALQISIITDPSSTHGEAVTMDISRDMETFSSTPLVVVPEWPLWREIVHYHVTLPTRDDIDHDAWDYWLPHRVNIDPADDERYRMRVEGCREIYAYLKAAPLIKTLTIDLKFDNYLEVREALQPLLHIKGVEKATLLVDVDDVLPPEYETYIVGQETRVRYRSAQDRGLIDREGKSYNSLTIDHLRSWEKILEQKEAVPPGSVAFS